jgi:hypothetical protein
MAGKPSPLATLQSLARQLGEALEREDAARTGACSDQIDLWWANHGSPADQTSAALAAFDKAKKEGLL